MPLPPLTHQLSNFEQIEILRHEIEQFEDELKKTESRIRDVLYQIEKQRFLMTVHQIFQHGPIIAESEALPEMYNTRETLAGALEAMKQALAELEAVSGPTPPRPPQSSPSLQRTMPARMSAVQPSGIGGANSAQPGSPPVRKNRFDPF